MAKVIPIGALMNNDDPTDKVLEESKGKLAGVVILGFDPEGYEYYRTSIADGGEVIWLLERCKNILLDNDD